MLTILWLSALFTQTGLLEYNPHLAILGDIWGWVPTEQRKKFFPWNFLWEGGRKSGNHCRKKVILERGGRNGTVVAKIQVQFCDDILKNVKMQWFSIDLEKTNERERIGK